MGKLSERLRAHRIFNTHEILLRFGDKGCDVAVSYRSGDGWTAAHTHIWSPTFDTDSEEVHRLRKNKTFVGRRAESRPKALAWATITYGITLWAPSPGCPGDTIPQYVLDRAKEFLKAREDG